MDTTKNVIYGHVGSFYTFYYSAPPPFYGKNEKETFQKILDGNVSFKHKLWSKISEEAKNLVTKLLEVDPNKRLSAAQALEHVWFKKNINLDLLKETKNPESIGMFMKNITEFCAEQKLQQATLAFLVHNFAPIIERRIHQRLNND